MSMYPPVVDIYVSTFAYICNISHKKYCLILYIHTMAGHDSKDRVQNRNEGQLEISPIKKEEKVEKSFSM